jgi:hypothetical protein
MHWDPFLQRGGGGSIVAKLWQTRWDPPRRPQGGAQPVVDRPVRADPFWTHSLLTIMGKYVSPKVPYTLSRYSY